MTRKPLFLPLLVLVLVSYTHLASASSNGISGQSGRTGSTCANCHSNSGPAPAVTITGPTSVASGSTNTYTLTSGGTGFSGLDVAASAGTFTAGTGTKVLNGEITHTTPSSTHSWTFSWTAPTVTTNTAVTFWGASIDNYGGGTGSTTLNITVTAPAAKPNLTASPTSLSFAYTIGGTAPAAKPISVGSSTSTVLTYTAAASASANWLSAIGGGNTPGNVSVAVNPTGLAAGTYNGSVTLTSAGAGNSPMTVPVTLTVTAAPPPPTTSLTVSPATLSFAYTTGGTAPAAKTVAVGSSSSTALAYTVAATGGSWLTATGGGNTPGNVSVSVNPAGLSAGTYNGTVTITSTGASNSPQKVAVTFTVSSSTPPPRGGINVSTRRLVFYAAGSQAPAAQTVSITNANTGSTAAVSYTAAAYGGSWLSVTPSAGNTPGKATVDVSSTGLPIGTYAGVVQFKGGNSVRNVEVVLVISASGSGGGGDDGTGEHDDAAVRPFNFDPKGSGLSNAGWVSQSGSQSLVLAKKVEDNSTALAGVTFDNVSGQRISQLGFDVQATSECTAKAPQIVVITQDDVVHTAGCASGTVRTTTATGWKRLRFNPADARQFTPAIESGTPIKTVALIMDQVSGKGIAVLDNFIVNGSSVSKD